tara:strand:- start:50 stop:277 length:228 start_codon:yes stop_codon:yes gene_type:complete
MIQELVDKILSYTSVSIKEKISRLLAINADIYCNLGTDSTKTEILQAKKDSRYIYRAIKTLDEAQGNQYLQHMDK